MAMHISTVMHKEPCHCSHAASSHIQTHGFLKECSVQGCLCIEFKPAVLADPVAAKPGDVVEITIRIRILEKD